MSRVVSAAPARVVTRVVTRAMTRAVIGVLAGGLLLFGCGHRATPDRDALVRATPRALAAVGIGYVNLDPTAAGPLRGLRGGAIGVELRFKGASAYQGDSVLITVEPAGHYTATDSGDETCAPLPNGRDDAVVRMCYQLMQPHQDPGYVVVTETRKRERVIVAFTGPDVSKDPRKLTSYFPVAQMASVADDPRVSLRTTPDTVEDGRKIHPWGNLTP